MLSVPPPACPSPDRRGHHPLEHEPGLRDAAVHTGNRKRRRRCRPRGLRSARRPRTCRLIRARALMAAMHTTHTRLTHGHARTRSSYELPCAVTAAFRLPQTPVTETKSPAAGPSLGSLSPVMRGLSLNHGLVRSDSGEERPAVSGLPRPGLLGGSWTSLLCGHVSLVTRSQTVSPCTWMSVTPQIPQPAPGTEEPAGRSTYQPARRGYGPTLPWGRGHRTWEGVRTSFSSTMWHPGSVATESVAFGRTLRTGRAQGSGAVGHGGQGRARRSSRCVHLVLCRASGTVGGAWGQPGQGQKPMPELAGASPRPQDRRNRAAARRVPTPLPPGLTSPVHVTSDSGRQPSPRQVASGRALCRAGGTARAGAAALGGF